MKTKLKAGIVMGVVGFAAVLSADAAQSDEAFRQEVKAGIEEIFVFRTTRTAQERGLTQVCMAAPFTAVSEDHYDLWSIELRASDSRVVKTHQKPVGEFRACFSQLTKDQPLNMYAIGKTANIPWTGVGVCQITKAQPPVRTALSLNCQLDLSGLPEQYAGGMGTSSSLAPLLGREQGPAAHVPGYLSTSIVTFRLWKKPPSQ